MNIYWILFSLPLLFISVFLTFKSIRSKKTSEIFFTIPYSILLLLFIYTLSLNSYGHFGLTHIVFTVICIYSGLILAHYIKEKPFEKYLEYIFSAIYFLMLIDRFFIYPGSIYYKLPLNICNIAIVLIAIRPFYKNKLIDAYIICFGLLGALSNTIIGLEYNSSTSFFSSVTFASNFDHNLFYTYIIYRLLKENINFKPVEIFKLAKYLIPIYIGLIFTNEIYKYNYFFTSRYENPATFLYDFFPSFIMSLFGYNFEINVIYYIFSITTCFSILYGTIFIIKKLQSKMTKNIIIFFTNNTDNISVL